MNTHNSEGRFRVHFELPRIPIFRTPVLDVLGGMVRDLDAQSLEKSDETIARDAPARCAERACRR